MRTAGDIMTKEVITVAPDSPLIEAVNILLKHGFNGLPVTANGMVVGIITEYDMLTKGSAVHIPTLIKMFGSLDDKGAGELKDELKKVMTMKVQDVMNLDPLMLTVQDDILKVVDTFTQHHKVNPIPIIDETKRLVGVISRSDMLKFMGDPNLTLSAGEDQKTVDQNIEKFISHFQNRFTLVTKARTRWWLVASIFFAFVGFAIAWVLIIQINF